MISPYRKDYQVDILIRGWNNLPDTLALISSIRANTDPAKYHITYVDNGSNNLELRGLMERCQDCTIVSLPMNMGSVRAINIGLALAMMNSYAPYALLMDNDTCVPSGDKLWLDRWVGYFEGEDNARVGAVGAVTDYASGYQNCESLIDLYNKDWEVEGEGAGIKDQIAMPVLVSFALMLRKTAVAQVGLFDERYEPKNFEDFDYTFALNKAGWKNHIAHSVWIHHRGQHKDTDMQRESMNTNARKFVAKWGKEELEKWGVMVK